MASGTKTYYEYRGVRDAVYAEITKDDSTGFTTGAVKNFTGVSEIARTTDSSSETHWYDNLPAIVIDSEGSDTIQVTGSGIPFSVVAELTGQYYDSTTGMFVEQERTQKYFAFGYVTSRTDGTDVYVWRLKGVFSNPGLTSATKNDGTDANGQQITFTGVSTTHKFTATGKPARAVNVETAVNTDVTEAEYFAAVVTPDTFPEASE